MRKDHRPFWLKRISAAYNRRWAEHFLYPQFDAVGDGTVCFGPQHIDVAGGHVRLGDHVHMMAKPDAPIRFTSYAQPGGHIDVGDYSIVLPGVRIASALSIKIGRNCMFAGYSYVTDADWHDIYDRTAAPGAVREVVLGDNVWVGDSAIVCKGVTVGDNTVIGAGSVVASDLPANVIAAGNPARVIKPLDPERQIIKRDSLFTGDTSYAARLEAFERWVLTPNTLGVWVRSRVAPTRQD